MVCRAPRMSTCGLLAGGSGAAELQQGLHVERLDDALEGDGRSVLHAGIGGADGGVEAVDGGVEGALGLLGLLGRGGGRSLIVFDLGRRGVVGCSRWRVAGCGRWRGNGLRSLVLRFVVYQARGVAVFGPLQGLRPRRLRLRRRCVGADVALRGKFATVVDDELFDICHVQSSSLFRFLYSF